MAGAGHPGSAALPEFSPICICIRCAAQADDDSTDLRGLDY